MTLFGTGHGPSGRYSILSILLVFSQDTNIFLVFSQDTYTLSCIPSGYY